MNKQKIIDRLTHRSDLNMDFNNANQVFTNNLKYKTDRERYITFLENIDDLSIIISRNSKILDTKKVKQNVKKYGEQLFNFNTNNFLVELTINLSNIEFHKNINGGK